MFPAGFLHVSGVKIYSHLRFPFRQASIAFIGVAGLISNMYDLYNIFEPFHRTVVLSRRRENSFSICLDRD